MPPVPDAPVAKTQSPYFAFTLLFLLYMFDYIDRVVVVSLFPFIKTDWGLSDMQLGLLVSAVYWSILIFALPASVIVDRWSRKNSIGIMSILWSLATVACAFTKSFGQLFGVRIAIGLGEAGYAPGGTAMISNLFPPEKRARLLGFWNASIPLGSAFGIVLGGFIAETWGWRHAFGVVALPGIIVALLFFRVKDYQTVDLVRTVSVQGQDQTVRLSRTDILREFLGNKTLILNNLGFAASVFVTTALMTWLPTYFHRVYDLSMKQASLRTGLVMILAIVGAPLAGFLADWWYKSQKKGRLYYPALSAAATAILFYVAFAYLHGTAQYLLFLAGGIAAVGFLPPGLAVTQDVVHPGLRAVSIGFNVVIQHILGSALGPAFIGAISDKLGLEKAMCYLPAFALLAGLFFLAASLFYNQDAARSAQDPEVHWGR